MLQDKDRIFQNLYNDGDSGINGAIKRNDWSNTKDLISKGRDWIIDEVKLSELRGRGGAGFPTNHTQNAPHESLYAVRQFFRHPLEHNRQVTIQTPEYTQ